MGLHLYMLRKELIYKDAINQYSSLYVADTELSLSEEDLKLIDIIKDFSEALYEATSKFFGVYYLTLN